jgi:hypothetical protein
VPQQPDSRRWMFVPSERWGPRPSLHGVGLVLVLKSTNRYPYRAATYKQARSMARAEDGRYNRRLKAERPTTMAVEYRPVYY